MATTVCAKDVRELVGRGKGTSTETQVSRSKEGSLEMVKMEVKISKKPFFSQSVKQKIVT